ncbi:MAG: M1 family metallopeptidase [Bacteroidia bacterium]|nr:M1 family metallopeptidase [Bacteroidia bacterium]
METIQYPKPRRGDIIIDAILAVSPSLKLLFLFVLNGFLLISKTISQEYFQQQVNYIISVELNDSLHELTGFESIEYINNSSDTLTFLYFHLWPNAYKDKYTALSKQQANFWRGKLYFSDAKKCGYIDRLDFKVNDSAVRWEYDPVNQDICKILLNQSLYPGQKMKITTTFHVKIPSSEFSRLGHYEQSYQITQWYPKPAVYDKDGWHQMPYLDIGEFYSEFGSFDVSITLPENYIVAATGNLQNEAEQNRLDSLSDTDLSPYLFSFGTDPFPASSKKTKTLRYLEDNIHDFAWFADKRYIVRKGEIQLPHSGRKVALWSVFTPSKTFSWKNSLEYIHDALYYYSLWIGDYPYNNCTAVEGALSAGGGMEYPGITIIGDCSTQLQLEEVIMHEVGHNWFYGVLGNNEREAPWLDEGINTFYQLRYMLTKYPALTLSEQLGKELVNVANLRNLPYISYYELLYLINAKRILDQPSNLQSQEYSAMNYSSIVYMKTAFLFNYLKEYLGVEKFDIIMKKYYEIWKFKHPQPNDLYNIFKENTGKNIDWFFNDLLSTTKPIDYKIKSVKKSYLNDSLLMYNLTIVNKAKVQAPITLSAIKDGNIISQSWMEGFTGKMNMQINSTPVDKFMLDANHIIPDINKKNNTILTRSFIRRPKSFNLRFLGGYSRDDKYDIYYSPIVGWNYYNKWMFGFLLYNSLLPNRKFEYFLSPFYATGNNNIAGNAKISYTWFKRDKLIRYIMLTFSASQYAAGREIKTDFRKYKGELNITLKKNHKEPLSNNRLILNIISATDIYNIPHQSYFCNAGFCHAHLRMFNPYNFSIYIQGWNSFIKAWTEADYTFTYNSWNKGLTIRFFAGKFFRIIFMKILFLPVLKI